MEDLAVIIDGLHTRAHVRTHTHTHTTLLMNFGSLCLHIIRSLAFCLSGRGRKRQGHRGEGRARLREDPHRRSAAGKEKADLG